MGKNPKQRRLLTMALTFLGILSAVLLVNKFSGGSFITPGNITNVLRQITFNAILAAGMTLVIVTAGIDLSVGSLIALTGVVMALFANAMPFGGPLLCVSTLLVGIGIGGTAGLINALPVVKLKLPPFITTLPMLLMASGLAYKISHGQPIPVKTDAFSFIADGYLLPSFFAKFGLPGLPVVVVWMLVILLGFGFLLGRTRFGRYVYAIGGNEEASRLAGINVGQVKILVYILSGCCAAIAGFLLMARFQSGSPNTGEHYELQAIAAVVVGGTSLMGGRGKVIGTFVGALLIGVLNNALNLMNVESYTQLIVLGAVILIAVCADEVRKRYWVS